MKSRVYLIRSIALSLCLAASIGSWAQSSQKPYPAVKRGRVIQRVEATEMKATAKDNKETAKEEKSTIKEKQTTKPKSGEKRVNASRPKAESSSGRYIALKTNVPFAALAVQNLALEVQCHEHISIDFPVMWSISDIERRHAVRTFSLQPEGRWWMDAVGSGHFFGLHTHLSWFNLKWNDDRYQSGKRPLLGAGISYGYKLPLSRHWGAEFNIGAGYANMKYNTYYNIENGAKIDTSLRNYWGITRLGISLVYRF